MQLEQIYMHKPGAQWPVELVLMIGYMHGKWNLIVYLVVANIGLQRCNADCNELLVSNDYQVIVICN